MKSKEERNTLQVFDTATILLGVHQSGEGQQNLGKKMYQELIRMSDETTEEISFKGGPI